MFLSISQSKPLQFYQNLLNYVEKVLILPRRNSRIGYCQGLNILACYFLNHPDHPFSEEETFWILTCIIEEHMPNEYYTNMLSVIADLKILQILFKLKEKTLFNHFKKVGIDLVMIALPCFITLFTNCENKLCDVIMDAFFVGGGKKAGFGFGGDAGGGGRGPVILIKAMVIIFGYMKKDLMEIQDLRKKLTL